MKHPEDPITPEHIAWVRQQGVSVYMIAKACGTTDDTVKRWARGLTSGAEQGRANVSALLPMVRDLARIGASNREMRSVLARGVGYDALKALCKQIARKSRYLCDFCGCLAPLSLHTVSEKLPGVSGMCTFRFCTPGCKKLWLSEDDALDEYLSLKHLLG